MSFSFTEFHSSISQEACGLTLDWQRTSSGEELCQWLWGRPITKNLLGKSQEELLAIGAEVSKSAVSANLLPVDPHEVGMNLPNETAVIDNCPFRPESCPGDHVVVSGTGRIKT